MQGVPYGTLKWTWFYRVWTGDPGARQRDSGGGKSKGQRQAPLSRRGPQAGALAATRPFPASRHSRPHKETTHRPNTLPVGAGDVCTLASARSPREHLRTRRPPGPFSPRDVEAGRSGGARSRGVDHAPRCPRRPRYCSRAAPAPRAFPGGGSRPGKGSGRPGRRRPRTHPAMQPTATGKPAAVSGAVPRWPRPLLSPARGSAFRPRRPASAAPLTNRDAGRQRARPPTSSRRAPPPRLRAVWGEGRPRGPGLRRRGPAAGGVATLEGGRHSRRSPEGGAAGPRLGKPRVRGVAGSSRGRVRDGTWRRVAAKHQS